MQTLKNFISIYKEHEQNLEAHTCKQNLSRSFVKFLDSLKEDEKVSMSLNIFNKFAEKESIEKVKRAKTLLLIYSRKLQQSNKNCLRSKLAKWRIINKIEKDSHIYKTQIGNSKSSSIEPSSVRKEKEELKNCTFRPEINKNYFAKEKYDSYNNNCNTPAYERLYTEYDRIQIRKDKKFQDYENRKSNGLTFTPDLSKSSNKINKSSQPSQQNISLQKSFSKSNFLTRQEKFKRSKEKNKQKIIQNIEEEMKTLHTFSPKILKTSNSNKTEKNESFNTYNNCRNLHTINCIHTSSSYKNLGSQLPVYMRLYRISKERSMSKSLSRERSLETKKSIDSKRIDKLYNDHKVFNVKKKNLRKSIDLEQGITFKPEVLSNEKYSPSMKFMERNEKLLNDKKDFFDQNHQILEAHYTNLGGRKFSSIEAPKIKQEVVQRLYHDDLDKFKKKNSIVSIHERESLDFNAILRNSELKLKPNEEQINCLQEEYSSSLAVNENKPKSQKNFSFGMSSLSNSQAKEKEIAEKEHIYSIDNYTFGKDKNINKYNYQFEDFEDDKEERVKPLYMNSNRMAMNINSAGSKKPSEQNNYNNLKTYIQHRRISSKEHNKE
jgi:hypothetical protein